MASNAQRRPSPADAPSHGLWSLWDMMNHWGYRFLGIGTALAYSEAALEQHRWLTKGAIAGHGTSILPPDSSAADLAVAKCTEILNPLAEKLSGARRGHSVRFAPYAHA